MGLYTSYSDTNKRNIDLPYVEETYTGEVIEDSGSPGTYYAALQTITTEGYQYFGMTETAAGTCVTAINALSSSSTKYTARGHRVADSNMWNVDVTKVTTAFSWKELT